jgi:hypothetical protein
MNSAPTVASSRHPLGTVIDIARHIINSGFGRGRALALGGQLAQRIQQQAPRAHDAQCR